MIKKKIIKYNTFIFISIMSLFFYSNALHEKIYHDTDEYKNLAIEKAIEYLNQPENEKIKKEIYNKLIPQTDNKKNPYLLKYYQLYKDITKENITKENFINNIEKNREESINFAIKYNKEVFNLHIDSNDKSIDIVKTIENFNEALLGNKNSISLTELADEEIKDIGIIQYIIQQKELELKIQEEINIHYNNKKSEDKKKSIENNLKKYLQDKSPQEKKTILNNLNFRLKDAILNGDFSTVQEIIVKMVNTNNKENNDFHNEEPSTMLKEELQILYEKIEALKNKAIENKNINISKEQMQEFIEEIKQKTIEQTDANEEAATDMISQLNQRITAIEKKNKTQLYIILILSSITIFGVYKYFFPSENN